MRNAYFEEMRVKVENGEMVKSSRGQCIAYNEYVKSVKKGYGVLKVGDFLFAEDMKDLLKELEKAEIDSFVLTDSSSELMDLIHETVKNGWLIAGPYTISSFNDYGDLEEVKGIKFNCM